METLQEICIHHISKNSNLYESNEGLKYIPDYLKTRIVKNISCFYKGFHNDFQLKSLLHKFIIHLDLNSSTITDISLEVIVEKSPFLKILKLSGANYKFSKAGLIKTIPKLKRLEEFHLSNSNEVDDIFIDAIAKNCSNLQTLDLNSCPNITDQSFDSIENLKLARINFSKTKITNTFLKRLGSSVLGEYLIDVNISNCNITCIGLAYLRWDKMKYVGCQGCEVHDLEYIRGFKSLEYINWTISN